MSTKDNDKKSLSAGQIVAIVVPIVLVVAIVIIVVIYFTKFAKKNYCARLWDSIEPSVFPMEDPAYRLYQTKCK